MSRVVAVEHLTAPVARLTAGHQGTTRSGVIIATYRLAAG